MFHCLRRVSTARVRRPRPFSLLVCAVSAQLEVVEELSPTE